MALTKDAVLAVSKMALQTAEYNTTCLRAVVSELDAIDPSDEKAILDRQAYALYYAGMFDQALPRFRALVAIAPSSDNLVKYGQLLLAKHEFEQAVAAIDEALRREPKHHLGLQTRATALLSLGRFDEALESAEKAATLRDDPRSVAIASLAASQLGRQTSVQSLSKGQQRLADALKRFGEAGLNGDKIELFMSRMEAFALPLPRGIDAGHSD
jgi:tetratricopeptide (TPR) repeat protein